MYTLNVHFAHSFFLLKEESFYLGLHLCLTVFFDGN